MALALLLCRPRWAQCPQMGAVFSVPCRQNGYQGCTVKIGATDVWAALEVSRRLCLSRTDVLVPLKSVKVEANLAVCIHRRVC
eukprot:4893018-Amphidinium_carterae.2